MKKILVIAALLGLTYACSNGSSEKKETTSGDQTAAAVDSGSSPEGVGKFKHVDLSPTLDKKLADGGKAIYDMKCSACHKLTGEKLVGPGWKGVTERRKPEWIMNFVTNTDEMLNRDTAAQAMLEICMVKMPNQNLSDEDARKVLEFMRENDGVK
jgi:mono/diheme cytochrome c family protein